MLKEKQKKLAKKVKALGFQVINPEDYENQNSMLDIECENGHRIKTSWKYMRSEHFRCAACDGGTISVIGGKTPPKKDGSYRIIALDNATEKMGLAVFDDGELVFYTLLKFSGLLEERLKAIYDVLNQVILNDWEPDYVVFEDIQYQQNYKVYKVLGMLFGVISLVLKQHEIEHTHVQVKTWREHFQISSARKVAKFQAISKVKTMYDIEVGDDEAEAILLGKYASNKLSQKFIKKGF